MVHAIERLSEVQKHSINLETIIQRFAPHVVEFGHVFLVVIVKLTWKQLFSFYGSSMGKPTLFFELALIMFLLKRINATDRVLTCGFINGLTAEFDAVNSVFSHVSSSGIISVVLKEFNNSEAVNLFSHASNVIALIEGSAATTPTCALSTVTGIPLIRLHGNNRRLNQCDQAILMSAGYKDYAHATIDILNTFAWKNIVVVYEESRVHEAGYLHAVSQKSQLKFDLVQFSEHGKIEERTEPADRAMEQVQKFDAQVIVLYMENKNIKLMLQKAKKLNSERRPLPYPQELVAVGYDAVQIIQKAGNSEPCLSINGSVFGSKDANAMLTCIRKVILHGVTGLLQFNENGERVGVQLEILNLRNNSFKKDAPFAMKRRKEDGEVFYEGYCIDLLIELAGKLKFTYELYTSPDGKYGAENENGTWNGVINEILNERADMAIPALTITERREKVVDFSFPFMHFTTDILLRKPSFKEKIDLSQFMAPFDNQVWFATSATLIIISVAVFVLNFYSPYGYKDDNDRGTSKEFSFFNSVWFALACMLQQGGDNTPKSLSGEVYQ
ncbi:Glutamate receptor 4 [Stylophora pistillata]|uniref:Glutamate receptor 4 n=1 Tax=Stylophora pistillata TaxID=50429 RepID=A0A2B4SPI5_STYPI|nr:Glutamate receptor 4 [Stylophora pistillata]